jgi:hypothetical protein
MSTYIVYYCLLSYIHVRVLILNYSPISHSGGCQETLEPYPWQWSQWLIQIPSLWLIKQETLSYTTCQRIACNGPINSQFSYLYQHELSHSLRGFLQRSSLAVTGPVEFHAFSKWNWRHIHVLFLSIEITRNRVHLEKKTVKLCPFLCMRLLIHAIVKKDFVQILLAEKSLPVLRSLYILHLCLQVPLLPTYMKGHYKIVRLTQLLSE